MSFADRFLRQTAQIANAIDRGIVEKMAATLANLRDDGGRLFIAGLGGGAGNASHAANDFRKLAGIEAYCVSDNVSELTARANDEGFETIYSGYLQASRASSDDALMILSVGGGTDEVSVPLVRAIAYAMLHNIPVLGIVGRDGGYTKKFGSVVLVIPEMEFVTAHTEAFQSVILHCLVSHIQKNKTKW